MDDVEDGRTEGLIEDGSTEGLVERETLAVGFVLVRVVCIVAGSEPKENSWDGSEQHPESAKS